MSAGLAAPPLISPMSPPAALTPFGSGASIPGILRLGPSWFAKPAEFVSGADGEANYLETGSICCGNETMHRELLGLLRGVA